MGTGISVICVDFFEDKLSISLRMSSISTCTLLKSDSSFERAL